MKERRFASLRLASALGALAAAAALGGCGAPGAGAGPGEPDNPVVRDAPPVDRGRGAPRIVLPTPGLADVRPAAFTKLSVAADGRVVLGRFYNGVAPCYGVDRVEVDYAPRVVSVGVFVGSDPVAGDVACPDLAELVAVRIPLREPLAGRRLVDVNA